ncbi:TNFRSF10B isoform 4 [Pongo abelii]|uniref:TNFRSF10B isoform 4 n=1 Tax=Pongo abelii TaxID=9601 RepID=A0A2J8X4S7_PONAB|nr:TNFRSF10B isoform 4 [Pongo abelii]
MEQRGQNAPAASGARKRRGPGPREVRGAGPGLRVPKTLVLVVAAVLLLDTISQKIVETASPANTDRTIALTGMTSFSACAAPSVIQVKWR